jgi:hypothetical protein
MLTAMAGRKSTIPVPEVFAYDGDSSNEAEVAYTFLEYIHGTTASELGEIHGSTTHTLDVCSGLSRK